VVAPLVGLGWLLLGSPGGQAQNFGLGLNAQDNGKPINIEAEQGIEWQQNNHVYIARGNARATRGQATLFGDTLTAFYRPICGGDAAAAPAKDRPLPAKDTTKPARPQATQGTSSAPTRASGEKERACPDGKGAAAQAGGAVDKRGNAGAGDPIGGNSTEIYRVEADGNVRIATETQTVYGDHAVYEVDQARLVVTGRNLKLETPRDTVTARDSLEWYDDKQLAVARGDAVAVREGKRLRGDVLTAEVLKEQNQSSHISRIDATGNVLVSSLDQIARGDAGVYNVDTGIATLTGRVTLTRADNELRGQYAVIDLNNNVSRLLSAPPSAKLTDAQPRVHGLLVPRQKPQPPTAQAPTAPSAVQ
jgi:lipopolysaccharide export system protein LptA